MSCQKYNFPQRNLRPVDLYGRIHGETICYPEAVENS